MGVSATMFDYRQVRFLTSVASIRGLFPRGSGPARWRSRGGRTRASRAPSTRSPGRRHLARTSRTPGRTRLVNFFELDEERRLGRSARLRLRPGPPIDEPRMGCARRQVPRIAGVAGRGGGADGYPPPPHRARRDPCSTGAVRRTCRLSRCSPRPTSLPAADGPRPLPRRLGVLRDTATRCVRWCSRRRSASGAASSRHAWTSGSGESRGGKSSVDPAMGGKSYTCAEIEGETRSRRNRDRSRVA